MDAKATIKKLSLYIKQFKSNELKNKLIGIFNFVEQYYVDPLLRSITDGLDYQVKTKVVKPRNPIDASPRLVWPLPYFGPDRINIPKSSFIPLQALDNIRLDNKELNKVISWEKICYIHAKIKEYEKIRNNCHYHDQLQSKIIGDCTLQKIHNAFETNQYSNQYPSFSSDETRQWSACILTVFTYIRENLSPNPTLNWWYNIHTGTFYSNTGGNHTFKDKYISTRDLNGYPNENPFENMCLSRVIMALATKTKQAMRLKWTPTLVYNQTKLKSDPKLDHVSDEFVKKLNSKFNDAIENINEHLAKIGMIEPFFIKVDSYTFMINPIYLGKKTKRCMKIK
jgi:hypothetical protein